MRPVTSTQRRGFSLLEAVIAMLLVGVVLVAALHVLAGTTASTLTTAQHAAGVLLAEGLLAETLTLPYAEPDAGQTAVFGPEAGETGGSRAAFDDVDDYRNWSASPPESPDGTVLPGYAGWTRSVAVAYLDPSDLNQVVASDMGVKRVTVTASFNGRPVAVLTAIRTDGEAE